MNFVLGAAHCTIHCEVQSSERWDHCASSLGLLEASKTTFTPCFFPRFFKAWQLAPCMYGSTAGIIMHLIATDACVFILTSVGSKEMTLETEA